MTFGELATIATAARTAALAAAPSPATARPADSTDRLLQLLTDAQLARVTRSIGLTVPALRAGHSAVTKRPATWPLRCWYGDALSRNQPAWLANPDPRLSWWELCSQTLDDAVWHDRAYWRVTARGGDGYPLAFERIDPQTVEDDGRTVLVAARQLPPGTPGPVVLQGGRILESVIPFRWQGMGGMAQAGSTIVDLALKLLAASAMYAANPMPAQAIRNTGTARLTDTEVDDLLAGWETARRTRSTAYLSQAEVDTFGWSAKELQQVEAREHAALEIARALSLPAFAVDTQSGDSMTYANVTDRRRDLVAALRTWVAPLEQGLSLHAAPRGTDVRFDVTEYLRDDPATRMAVWAQGIAAGVLTVDEARAQEPLAFGPGGADR